MINSIHSSSFENCLHHLRNHNVIAYPTEAVFGLGCDPDDEQAVLALLALKQRPIEKGLILIAAAYSQLEPYIADRELSVVQRERMLNSWPGPVTWVAPAKPQTPRWLTGQFDSLAIRVSDHPDVRALCQALGKPIVSTSANLSGQPPCRSVEDVLAQFGSDFPVLAGVTGGRKNPSEIKDVITGALIRQG